jgi:hypothetical protein
MSKDALRECEAVQHKREVDFSQHGRKDFGDRSDRISNTNCNRYGKTKATAKATARSFGQNQASG